MKDVKNTTGSTLTESPTFLSTKGQYLYVLIIGFVWNAADFEKIIQSLGKNLRANPKSTTCMNFSVCLNFDIQIIKRFKNLTNPPIVNTLRNL